MISPPSLHELVIRDNDSGHWMRFGQPEAILVANTLDEVLPALRRVESSVVEHGKYAAGWVAYEAANAFDRALITKSPTSFPLLWFGIYSSPQLVDLTSYPVAETPVVALDWQSLIPEPTYQQAIARIKEAIAAGDTYQVNFTFRITSRFNQNAWQYFLQLNRARPATYAAYLETEEWAICSSSPELFFQLNGDEIACKPMKGTAARGLTQLEDLQQAEWLLTSEKNRAENLMIVDMVRNDLGRIAEVGSVVVSRLFDIEKYPTLWQMTSTVNARTKAGLCDIFQSMFPPASITGAPKASTMAMIHELESSPRKLYTGSIGFITPQRRAQFNVAIRTVLIDKRREAAEYGVGSGIVWDSQPQAEYAECLTKTKILSTQPPEFAVFETLLWTPSEGYFLLEKHLARLKRSADYFGYPINEEAIREALDLTESNTGKAKKVRLFVGADGQPYCEVHELEDLSSVVGPKICLARRPIDSSDRFLYHKTTHREVYKNILREHQGYDDVILWNEHGEITESCFANVVINLDGTHYTPPIRCGLLAGVYREWMLEQNLITERIITVADLKKSTHLCLINSVRKQQRVTVCDYPE